MARTPKTLQQARQNLEASIPVIAERYRMGINNADWKTGAESDNAESLWAAKTAEAARLKKRQAGIRRVSNEDWRQAAITRGADNIGPGIQANLDKFETNSTQAYNRMLSAQRSLPPKGADANGNIDRRLKPIVAAWQGR